MTRSEFEELRLQLGLSVPEMAAIVGAAPRDVQNFEAGRSRGVRRAAVATIRRLLHRLSL
jgi:DNA-binding transcriptional regulator YiaG